MNRAPGQPTRRPWHRPAGRPPARRAAGGFTLIEVMVALAVVALALGAGMKAAGALTDNAQRLGDVVAAQWCADNRLTELRLARNFPGNSETEFSCEQLGRSFTGKQVASVHPYNPNFSLVRVSLFDAQGRQVVQLATLAGRY